MFPSQKKNSIAKRDQQRFMGRYCNCSVVCTFFHAQKTGCVLIPNHYVSTRRDTDFNLSLLNGVFNMNAPLLQKCDILMWSLMWNQLKRKYKREFSKQMAAIASRQQTCQINVKYAINQRKLALFITKIILLIRNFK